jgi:hypothetical protein
MMPSAFGPVAAGDERPLLGKSIVTDGQGRQLDSPQRQFHGARAKHHAHLGRASCSIYDRSAETAPFRWAVGFSEQNIRNQLAQAMLDPKAAGGLPRMQPTTGAASALRSREDLFGTSAGALGDSIMYPTNEAAAPRLMDSVTGRARPSLEQQLMRTRGY